MNASPTCRTGQADSRAVLWTVRLLAGLLVAIAFLMLTGSPSVAQMGGHDQLQRYIERNQELLEWAQDLVSETESGPARKVLRQADDLHRRSRGMYEGGRMVEAYNVARRSRAAIGHAVRLARESMGLEERIRIRADRIRDQHAQLMERARDMNSRQAGELLDRARVQADRAREQYHQGDFEQSWRMLEQSEEMMRRAARILADEVGPERLAKEIERTSMLIGQARDRLDDNASGERLGMLEEAEDIQRRAREAMDRGQPGLALQQTTLARRLATRAGLEPGEGPGQEAVKRQLERFDERSARIGDLVGESGSEAARNIYAKALRNREQAADMLAKGEDEQALRQIRAAHDFLNQAEDLIR